MNIKVQAEDGTVKTLMLDGAFTVQTGVHLDRIVTGDGTEYFFTKEGYYDGWGMGVCHEDPTIPAPPRPSGEIQVKLEKIERGPKPERGDQAVPDGEKHEG